MKHMAKINRIKERKTCPLCGKFGDRKSMQNIPEVNRGIQNL